MPSSSIAIRSSSLDCAAVTSRFAFSVAMLCLSDAAMLYYSVMDYNLLSAQIRSWADELGFQQLGISDCRLEEHEGYLNRWLAQGFHGEMEYMSRHGSKRSRPAELVPGTVRVISVRYDYEPGDAAPSWAVIEDDQKAFVSRYALGRDYHRVLRQKLSKLSKKIAQVAEGHGFRAFTDSAPVLEKALAEKSGLGWIGKHTNLINSKAGSWFFLGEIYTSLPLPVDDPATNHCGSCRRCIDICPTRAIVAPYQVDARRCISYLTIELKQAIPLEFRPLIGNRIYGCDDCQLVCPWNKFSRITEDDDFNIRHDLDRAELVTLFQWSEQEFLDRTEGMAIRRIGHECWQRNIAVAMGNSRKPTEAMVLCLKQRRQDASPMLLEHIDWALDQISNRSAGVND